MCCVSGGAAEKRFTVSVCVHVLAGGHALTGRGCSFIAVWKCID